MKGENIKIECFTVKELKVLLEEKDFWFQNVTPITRHRAQLLVHNPRAQPDDPALFIAREGDEIVGYRAVLVDHIYVDGETIRIGWGSSFWVSEHRRGQGVGRLLFQDGYERWKGITGSLLQSRDAARVYERDKNFFCFNNKEGYQFILRLNSLYWLQRKVRVPRWLAWIFAPLDLVVNALLAPFRAAWVSRRKPMEGLRVEYCREIVDRETIDFVNTYNEGTLTRKTVADLNAIVRYPTSLATPLEDAIASRYFFAIKSARFDYLYFKVYNLDLNLKAVVLLNIDGGTLKLLYYFCESRDVLPRVFDVVLLHAHRLKTEIISSYDAEFNEHILKTRFPRLSARKQVRKSFVPEKFRSLNLQRYKTFDGDVA